jgi:hypothetical protein
VKGMYKYKVITWSETATSYDKNNERLPMQVFIQVVNRVMA